MNEQKDSINEAALRDALAALRRVGSRSRDDDKGKVVLLMDSIDVELERINGSLS